MLQTHGSCRVCFASATRKLTSSFLHTVDALNVIFQQEVFGGGYPWFIWEGDDCDRVRFAPMMTSHHMLNEATILVAPQELAKKQPSNCCVAMQPYTLRLDQRASLSNLWTASSQPTHQELHPWDSLNLTYRICGVASLQQSASLSLKKDSMSSLQTLPYQL